MSGCCPPLGEVAAPFEHTQEPEVPPRPTRAIKVPQAVLALGVVLTIVWTGGLVWLLIRMLEAFI